MVLVKTPDDKQRQLRIAGLVHDISRLSPVIQGIACGYVTFDTLEWLGVPRNLDELHIVVAENALVINHDLLRDDPDVEVGDEIVLKIDGRETTWQVVGLVKGILTSVPPIPFVYANYPYYARLVRHVGRAGSVQVVTEQHDADFQSEVAKALEEHFKRAGLRVSSKFTTAERRTALETAFNPIIILLFVMAVLLAVVGGLGLMGTMSLNVLERTREIGVMRAIGASDGAVRQVFMVEGILIGLLSWLLGAGLALPLSKLLSDAVGLAFTKASLSYTFSVNGVLLWLVVVILAALASFLPARSASRLTVREVLAYE
jgi:putative ABC transport system permease protein